MKKEKDGKLKSKGDSGSSLGKLMLKYGRNMAHVKWQQMHGYSRHRGS
jgi:hypothetical protein